MNWKLIRVIDEYIGIPLLVALTCLRRPFRRPAAGAERPAMRKILLVKFWGIGNLFMMLPSVAALRSTHAGARIDLLTLETSRSAAAHTGAFDGISTVDTKNAVRFVLSTFGTLRGLMREKYDCVIDFEQFARFSALCVALIGGMRTIGFNTRHQHRHLLYSDPVAYDNTVHVTRSYYQLAERAGLDGDRAVRGPVVFRTRASDVAARLGLRPGGLRVVLHVGTSDNFSERRWPTSSYAALADILIQHYGAQVVLTGIADERALAAEVMRQVRFREGVVDASGGLQFTEYYDLLCSGGLVVSADTAAVHIASAAGVPVIGLYGPNTPALYGPWGERGFAVYRQLRCSPCITNFNAKTHNCRHPEGKGACMRAIPVEEVYRVISEELFERAAPAEEGIRAGKASCDR